MLTSAEKQTQACDGRPFLRHEEEDRYSDLRMEDYNAPLKTPKRTDLAGFIDMTRLSSAALDECVTFDVACAISALGPYLVGRQLVVPRVPTSRDSASLHSTGGVRRPHGANYNFDFSVFRP